MLSHAASGDPEKFASAVKAVRMASKRPLILVSRDPAVVEAGLKVLPGEVPLIHAADASNWQAMAGLAKQYKAALAVSAATVDEAADLTEKIKTAGLEDLVLDPGSGSLGPLLTFSTLVRRLALKKNFRPLGYPSNCFPEVLWQLRPRQSQNLLDLSSWKVFHQSWFIRCLCCEKIFTPIRKSRSRSSLVFMRSTIPNADSPVLVTTNFSITYFSVANEVERIWTSSLAGGVRCRRNERSNCLGCWEI